MEGALLSAVIALSVIFCATIGAQDCANAIASAVAARTLTVRVAIRLAAVMSLVGTTIGTAVGWHFTTQEPLSIIDVPEGMLGLGVLLAALIGAIGWNLLMTRFGLPVSTSQTMAGALIGAGLVAGARFDPGAIWRELVVLLAAPLVVLGLAWLVNVVLYRYALGRGIGPQTLRWLHVLSCATSAATIGFRATLRCLVIVMTAYGLAGQGETGASWWLIALLSLALAGGTLHSGPRVMRTMGRLIRIDKASALSAQGVAAALNLVSSFTSLLPTSSTQTTGSALLGAGLQRGAKAVRWNKVGRVAAAWVATLPGTAIFGALMCGWVVAVTNTWG